MADGYYGYNPADYLKDYSWIGDIGQTIAQVAYKMPELVRYNRSVKENRQHNAENYGAMQEWVKWMQAEQPEVWNAVAKGYGVESKQLAPILTKQIRAPGKGEANEKYSRALLNDFVVPMFNAGRQGGITDDAFVRGISRMPRIAGSGERQGEVLKEYQVESQARKKRELEAAGAVEKREDIALAGEALAKARGVEREGIVPPGTAATREAVAADIGAIRPEALGRPEVRGITGILPTETQLAGGERAERRERRIAADVGEEKKPEGRVHARVAAEIKGITGDVRADTIRIDAKRSKIASIQRQLKEDDEQLIKSRKLPAAKRDKMDNDAKTLEAEIAGIQNKVEKGKRRIRDEQEALRIYDETGGKYTIEQIRQALKSGELYAPGGGGPPGITPSPAGPGRQAAPAGAGAGTQVGRFIVKQR